MQTPLLLSRRFAPLFACQFFSAFNDNFLKTALVFLVLFGTQGGGAVLITLASAVFIAPYFFLSGLGGELADRHDKAMIAQRLKLAEIGVAAVAVLGFALGSLVILFIALAGFGVIAALFGPIKYGILPDHLDRTRLPAANALIEGATFVAILTGTLTAGVTGKGGGNVGAISLLIMFFALACWLSALFIPSTGSGAPDLTVRANIVASTTTMLRHLRSDPRLWWGALVTSWFWLVGIVALALLPPMVASALGGNERTVTAFLLIFSVTVGLGCALAALIARGRIVLGTTLAGAALMGIFALDLGIALMEPVAFAAARGPSEILSSFIGLRVAADFSGLAFAGGLFIVPAFAAVQTWSGADYRARTIAAVNVLNAAFMTGATVIVAVLQAFGVTLAALFIGLGIVGLVVATLIWRTMPLDVMPAKAGIP